MFRFILLGLIALAGLIVGWTALADRATAEEKRIVVARNDNFHPFKPLFRLFGGKRVKKKVKKRRTRRRRNVGRNRLHRGAGRRRADKPAPVIIPKDPEASVVLVIGDSLARGLAKGLEVAFADAPKVSIRRWVNGSSGLVRDDFFNWPEKTREFLAGEDRVDVIVVMVGVNDRQSIRGEDGRHALRTEEWEKVYKTRIVDLMKSFAEGKKPAIWVGLPPTRSNKFSTDMAHFNDLYKAEAEAAGVTFIDIWQRFVDDEGRYTRRGPDVEGQTATLRSGDGIHFTGAGYRKVAFYIEKELRRVLKVGTPVMITTGEDAKGPLGPKIGAVLPLTGPIASAEDSLAGEELGRMPDEASAQYKVIVRGEVMPAVTGRADDPAWPRRP